VNSVIAKKVGDKHDEDDSDSDEDYKPPSVNRKPKSSRENKNNRDVSDISIILAALDNEFWRRGLVIDSRTTSVIARTKKRLCTKPIKGGIPIKPRNR
jgi:hypothetical protein